MKILIDTNRYSDFAKGDEDVVELFTTADLWIAALAVQHSLPLCSRDAHFEKVPQIARI